MLFAANFSIGQNIIEPDERLSAAYSEQDLIQMKTHNPETIELLNFKLDNSWFIAGEDIMQKVQDSPYLYYLNLETGQASTQMVEEINPENLNIAEYFIETNYNRRVFYRIGNSGIVIGFYSIKEFVEMYNENKSAQ
jgi:hypothetical protein